MRRFLFSWCGLYGQKQRFEYAELVIPDFAESAYVHFGSGLAFILDIANPAQIACQRFARIDDNVACARAVYYGMVTNQFPCVNSTGSVYCGTY